ncbi:MAG: hypothetical protein IT233_02705 [Bacteroidia bacterium]|nr:hypothetical protein [Bacteroidia bacterium]
MTKFEMTTKANTIQLVMGVVFCVVWFSILGFISMTILSMGTPPVVFAFLGLFALFGLIPVWVVIKNGVSTHLLVNETHVISTRTPLIGSAKRREIPLSDYSGITTGTRVVRRNKHNYTLHTVLLVHREKTNNHELGAYRDVMAQHLRAEECCKQIGLPLLRTGNDGNYVKTEAEDLDKKFSERTRKEDISTPLSAFPKSNRYVLTPLEGGFMITRKYPLAAFWVVVLYGVAIGFFLSPLWQPGIVLLIVGTLALGAAIKGGQYLLLQNDRVITFQTFFGQQLKRLDLHVDDIEEIIEAHDGTQGNVQSLNICVQVRSDKGFISFAHGAKKEMREWVRKSVSQYVFARQKREEAGK